MNNNDPARIATVLRSLIVFVVCAVVAIIIGVMMTNSLTYSSFGFIGAQPVCPAEQPTDRRSDSTFET
jgi:hypothetical protein